MAANTIFTLADLADQVCLNIGDTSDITEAKARKWLNRALVRFMEMGYWSWQREKYVPVPPTVGQVILQIPNILKVESLYMTGANNRRVALMEEREFRRRFSGVPASGSPYIYVEAGSARGGTALPDTKKFILYPTPDFAYDLRADVIRPITLLVNDTDDVRTTTGMPSNLVDCLIEMATAIGWKEIDDSDAASQMTEASQRLAAAYADDRSSIEDRFVFRADYNDSDRFFDPVLPGNYD